MIIILFPENFMIRNTERFWEDLKDMRGYSLTIGEAPSSKGFVLMARENKYG